MLVPHNKRVNLNNVMSSKKLQYKAVVPTSNIEIIWAPKFEWYVIRFGYENTHFYKKDTCLKGLDY